MVEALTSRCWPIGAVEELLSVKDLRPPLEPMEDLGSLMEFPKDGSCGAGSGGVDGARGYVSSPSIPVHTLV